jgi:uncharacterized phage protein (TIGR02216 family)
MGPGFRRGDMMNFAQSAARLAGIAGAMLGWRPEEFWRSTPEELAVIFAALAGEAEGAPLDRGALTRMQEMFPDG